MKLEELREKIAEEVGFNYISDGYSDSGKRSYGASDDYLIKLCFNFLTECNKPTSLTLEQFKQTGHEGLCWVEIDGEWKEAWYDHEKYFRMGRTVCNRYDSIFITRVQIIHKPEVGDDFI